MLLDTGHSAYQMSQAQNWSNFTVADPMRLTHLSDKQYLINSHDSENYCTLVDIDPATGFTNKKRFETENHKVFSACLLNSGV